MHDDPLPQVEAVLDVANLIEDSYQEGRLTERQRDALSVKAGSATTLEQLDEIKESLP